MLRHRCLGQLSPRTLPVAALLVLQGAASAAEGPVAPALVRPVAGLHHHCTDSRYPRLTGRFVVHCGPSGEPDRVMDLDRHEVVSLEEASGAWATLDGALYALGRDRGRWTLPAARPEGPGDRGDDATTPPAWDGRLVAYGAPGGLVLFSAGESTHRVLEARPAPWYPPALGGGWVAWTEIHAGDADLWGAPVDGGPPRLLAGGPGAQHHPVGRGEVLAWVDQGDVVVLRDGREERHPAEAGFESAPVLLDGAVCWGDRGGGELVVRCTDGFSTPGRRPSGDGARLMVHTPAGPVVYGVGASP